MKKIYVLLLIISFDVNAQFSIGFIAEGTDLITTEEHWIYPVNAIGIVLGYSPINKLNLEARFSYDSPLLVEYKGANYGLYLSYNIAKPIYIITSYTMHSNDGSSDEGVAMKKIDLLGAGAGINITPNFAFELVYSKALKKEPWVTYHDGNWQNYWSEDILGVIKANFKFHWKL